MADVIDLGLLVESKRVLKRLLESRGIRWFMASEGPRLLALDPAKVDLVVRIALRVRERQGAEPIQGAAESCHKHVRRELIRKVALAMLRTGC